jgi:FixJ family two-component response regulator
MQPRERLNSREVEVATMVWQGHTNRDIAREIGTSEQVVKNYCVPPSTSWVYGAGWNSRFTSRITAASSGLE